MPAECNPSLFDFAPVAGHAVVAAFDGGAITSDAGALLLGATDRAIRLIERFASCFADQRAPAQIILDLDATDDPLHGHQEGRFFHGYSYGVVDVHSFLILYRKSEPHFISPMRRQGVHELISGRLTEWPTIIPRTEASQSIVGQMGPFYDEAVS